MSDAIQRNMEARSIAEATIDLLSSELLGLHYEEQRQRVLELVHGWIWERLDNRPKPEVKPIEPMTEQEALAFEGRHLTFGKFVGVEVGMVELSYLTWFADQPDFEIKGLIRRYLKSQRGTDRLREEEE